MKHHDRHLSLGFRHLPGWIDAEWLKQLTAEQLVTVRTKSGFAGSNCRSCASGSKR
jgi:phage terminase large subunit GpA-like protein